VRVGLACPYTWDVPGGVQAHVRDLAEALQRLGHEVAVITPADDPDALPDYAVWAGRALPVPYNGSVARLLMGPMSAGRVRRWLRAGRFDVLHAHEPTAPSVSLLSCIFATGPVVATFHTSNPHSKILGAAGGALQPTFEKVGARIAVSEAARRTVVEHLGVDAVLIPNGVDVAAFAGAQPLDGWGPDGRTLVFVGRIDEPRKGLSLLLEALPQLRESLPGAQLLVAGPGDVEQVRKRLPAELRPAVHLLGLVSEADKRSVYSSGDVYVAPNTGQESFGIVLLEAMAAGTAVVASDIEAFSRVLDDGRAGRLFPTGDPAGLAKTLAEVLGDDDERRALVRQGRAAVQAYDWPAVAEAVLRVYESVAEAFTTAAAAPGWR